MEEATAETILCHYGLIEVQLWHCNVHAWYKPKSVLSLFFHPTGLQALQTTRAKAVLSGHKATQALHTKHGWGQNCDIPPSALKPWLIWNEGTYVVFPWCPHLTSWFSFSAYPLLWRRCRRRCHQPGQGWGQWQSGCKSVRETRDLSTALPSLTFSWNTPQLCKDPQASFYNRYEAEIRPNTH